VVWSGSGDHSCLWGYHREAHGPASCAMTDLGCLRARRRPSRRAEIFYAITDWHGWHYQYPPALAILFGPLAHPVPKPQHCPKASSARLTTRLGYGIVSGRNFYGLHRREPAILLHRGDLVSAQRLQTILSAHLLACALDRTSWLAPPPVDSGQRRQWWCLRLAPLILCIASVGTDLSRGQVDLLMLFAVAVALYLVGRRRTGWRCFCLRAGGD